MEESAPATVGTTTFVAPVDKPGQKYPTPSPGAGDRVFYESLWREKGVASDMALIWCVEHGIFMGKEVDDRYKDYLKAKGKAK